MLSAERQGRGDAAPPQRRTLRSFVVTRLDVVKVRVTSPVTREDVGSNPTWSIN